MLQKRRNRTLPPRVKFVQSHSQSSVSYTACARSTTQACPVCSQTTDLSTFRTPQLDKAVEDGDLSRCQTLVQQMKSQSPSSAITTKQLGPALGAPIGCKHLHIVAYLLGQGAVITGNIMILALGKSDEAIAMFSMFLDHGWDVNSKTDLGNTMLKWADSPSLF